MNCKYCKKEIENDSVFCRFCGERVQRKRKPKDEIAVAPPKITPTGKYRGRVMVNGSRVWITEDTEAAYYIRARAVKAGMIEQANKAPRDTLGQVIDKYLADNSPVLSPSTVFGYQSIRRTRFPDYMDLPIAQIPFQKMISDETLRVSSKTVKNAWRLVTASLKYAKMDVPAVNLPKTVRSERAFLDYAQIQIFVSAIVGNPFEAVFLLALHSLRLSEILALTSGSCAEDIIRVRGAMVRSADGHVLKELNKTDLSRRDIPIMIPRLADLIDQLPVRATDSAINDSLRRICAEHDLPDVTLHGLRHSFASLAYHLRWTEKTTMQLGGWATTEVVHSIYTHLAVRDVNDDVERMRSFYAQS